MKKDWCKVILYYNISLVGLLKLCCLWVECSTHVFEYLGSNPTNRDKLVTIYLSTFGRHFNKSYCPNRPKNNEAAKIITFPVESVLAILEKNWATFTQTYWSHFWWFFASNDSPNLSIEHWLDGSLQTSLSADDHSTRAGFILGFTEVPSIQLPTNDYKL